MLVGNRNVVVILDNLLDANDKLYKPIPCNNVLNNFNKSCMLPWDYTCDGIQHCHDNSDENYELCGNKSRFDTIKAKT